ncbi:MAG: AraC family transcriptional regulator [Burkholderiales bacterium]|nr:AraC family transcriptional regulator [Burkholderiales bacterium]MDE2452540.1 AraC family transcriptional regulator [Burkholderiales bacterium]
MSPQEFARADRHGAGPADERRSVIAGYAIAIARALEHKGVDSRRVFRAAGVPETISNDPLERLSGAKTAALYRACVDVTGDPYFGLAVAKFIHASNIHAVGYALLASRTLLDFCQRLERYFAVVSGSAMLRLERDDAEVALRFRHLTLICSGNEDACLAFVLHFMRLLYRSDFRPLRIEIHHPCPVEGPEPYEASFGLRPSFDHPESALVFAASALTAPLAGACPELAQLNDRIAGETLARLDKGDLRARVRERIVELMSSGDCSRRRVARELCMSEAALNRKLAQRGTRFQDLLNETRKELALGYLAQRSLSVTEIGFLLGFADTSNFTRAFKRWTGRSPTQHRSDASGPSA